MWIRWIRIHNTAEKNIFFRVADPNHFKADPDPAPHERGTVRNGNHWQTLQSSILSLLVL